MRSETSKNALVAGLTYIEENPEDWDQSDWSRCLAHWTAVAHPEVRAMSPAALGWHVIDTGGHVRGLGGWLEREYPDSGILWTAGRTLRELQAGVRAYVEDEDVDEAVQGAILGRLAAPDPVRVTRERELVGV